MRPHEDQTRFHGVDHEYKVGTTCAAPNCINQGAHKHHVWSRTALRKRGGGGWDAVIDQHTGVVLRNLVPLCHLHHQMLHDGLAHIGYDEDDLAYFWVTGGNWAEELKVSAVLGGLHPPTPPREVEHAEDRAQPEDGATADAVAGSEEVAAPGVVATSTPSEASPEGNDGDTGAAARHPGDDHAALAPGETCPTCERRVPHPKRASSPKSRTKAFRIPADEVEAFTELLDAVESVVGVREQPFSTYKTVLAALTLVLQQPEDVREFLTRRAA